MSAEVTTIRETRGWQGDRRAYRIQAFHPAFRRNVAELTRQAPPIADLADTFPGLLFALATDFGRTAARQDALRLVVEGAPLRQAAAVLELPWWLRRLPPQAFAEPLMPLAADDAAHERLGNLLPASPQDARCWLWIVGVGLNACHADFALWAAAWASRAPRNLLAVLGEANFRYLAAWAWYSGRQDALARQLMRRAWSTHMGPRRAVDELVVWRQRVRLGMVIGNALDDVWLSDGHAHGFDFVALRTVSDFIAESDAMDNCLDQFADRMEQGRSRVFSIRLGARSVADVEIGIQEPGAGMPAVLQLRGPRNRRASPGIWQATYAWLGAQPLRLLISAPMARDGARARRAARELWLPYLERLETPQRRAFRALLASDLGINVGPVQRRRRNVPRAA